MRLFLSLQFILLHSFSSVSFPSFFLFRSRSHIFPSIFLIPWRGHQKNRLMLSFFSHSTSISLFIPLIYILSLFPSLVLSLSFRLISFNFTFYLFLSFSFRPFSSFPFFFCIFVLFLYFRSFQPFRPSSSFFVFFCHFRPFGDF